MKRILQLLVFWLFIMLSCTLSAQTIDPKLLVSKAGQYSLNYSADSVLLLEGNVELKADKLKILKAEKVIFDKRLNKLIIFGSCEYSFTGKMAIVPTFDGKHTRLEYILGEDVAYIK